MTQSSLWSGTVPLAAGGGKTGGDGAGGWVASRDTGQSSGGGCGDLDEPQLRVLMAAERELSGCGRRQA